MRFFTPFVLILALALTSCVPGTDGSPSNLPGERAGEATLNRLLAPFQAALGRSGIVVEGGEAYVYEGEDPDAFVRATNGFYRSNPGFCPLTEAFFADDSGTMFLTLAGDGGRNLRGFLYDRGEPGRLSYAYMRATSREVLPVVTCETAQ